MSPKQLKQAIRVKNLFECMTNCVIHDDLTTLKILSEETSKAIQKL
jgi:hypothetical protein